MELLDELSRVKNVLYPCLANDGVACEQVTTELDALKARDAIQAYSAFFLLLAHLRFAEEEAQSHWKSIVEHRRSLMTKLGRDPGLRVTLMDYFVNLNKKLSNPKVIELTLYDQIERDAATDSLTGLYNYRHFNALLRRELDRAARYNQTKSLLYMDLDDFKDINDSFGHLHGDMVLVEVANIIRECVRTIDVAGRCGGEEFAVILPETDRYGAFTVGERIRASVQEHFEKRDFEGLKTPITLSGGVACYPDDGLSVEDVLKKADTALYQAKGAGKNQICVHYAERRTFIRLTLSDSVAVRQIEPVNGHSHGRTINISHGGVLFRADHPFDLGAVLEIEFKSGDAPSEKAGKVSVNIEVPPGTPAPTPEELAGFRAKARVVRLEDVGAGGEPTFEIGCCFLAGDHENEKRVLRYLQKNRVIPAR